jgi:hypothetical protein
MLQTALIILSFIIAIFFLGRQIYNSFFGKDTHCSSCSACSAIDFEAIENKMAEELK